MANKRMFTIQIIDSDAFLDMPLSTQALYFHLNMRADDDGFIDNPKKIMRVIGANQNDLDVLFAKRFILSFESGSGVIVIKHWRMHNTIRQDRYTPTVYKEIMKNLSIKENKSYTEKPPITDNNLPMATTWQPLGNTDIGLDLGLELDLDSDKEKDMGAKPHTSKFIPPTLEEVIAYCKERNNDVDAERFINFYTSKGWLVGKVKMKDWKASVRTWEKTTPKEQEVKKQRGTVI